LPLRGFLFETPICRKEEFREGNVSPGTGHTQVGGPPANALHSIEPIRPPIRQIGSTKGRRSRVRVGGATRGAWIGGGRDGAHHGSHRSGLSSPRQTGAAETAGPVCRRSVFLPRGGKPWAHRGEEGPPGLGLAQPTRAGGELPQRSGKGGSVWIAGPADRASPLPSSSAPPAPKPLGITAGPPSAES